MRRLALLAFVAGLAACSSSPPASDAGFADAAADDAVADDAAADDAAADDAAADDAAADDASAPDAEPVDAGSAGFGIISGACGTLDDELTSPDPSTVTNVIDFGTDPYDDADSPRLTEGGREIIRDGNAGGSSLLSEVFAYEVLSRCEGALLLKTETEVEYTMPGKITDLLVEIDGMKIGVSVTRAVTFPRNAPYTEMQAHDLIQRKLEDILASTANVAPADRWVKQILHIIAYGPQHVTTVLAAYATIDAAIRADTILYVTESAGDDEFIY